MKILLVIVVCLFMIIVAYIADRLGELAVRPYAKKLEEISKMDIPTSEKIRLMDNVKRP